MSAQQDVAAAAIRAGERALRRNPHQPTLRQEMSRARYWLRGGDYVQAAEVAVAALDAAAAREVAR